MVRSSALAAVIRHSCTTKLPISNMVFTRLLCWASHERASALRPETAHCRSLISHSRPAVSVSCASGLGGLCSWSKKYPPLTFATSGEVASHTRVSAPFSGLRDTGLRIVIPKPMSRLLLRLNPVATSPGWKQFAVTPVPSRASRQFSREQDVGQLGFAVAAKAPVGAFGVEIVERDVCSLMRLGCRSDDAGRRALFQPLEEELAEQNGARWLTAQVSSMPSFVSCR